MFDMMYILLNTVYVVQIYCFLVIWMLSRSRDQRWRRPSNCWHIAEKSCSIDTSLTLDLEWISRLKSDIELRASIIMRPLKKNTLNWLVLYCFLYCFILFYTNTYRIYTYSFFNLHVYVTCYKQKPYVIARVILYIWLCMLYFLMCLKKRDRGLYLSIASCSIVSWSYIF